MAKLVEILARELKEWPEDATHAVIHHNGVELGVAFTEGGAPVWSVNGYCITMAEYDVFWLVGCFINESFGLSPMPEHICSRAQWVAERARIANEELIEDPFPDTPDEALKRAANRKSTQEAREIARTGSMTSEEQELADIACGKRSKEDQALWDKVAMDQFRDFMQSEREQHFSLNQCDYARLAAEAADAFMAERAKRLKGV